MIYEYLNERIAETMKVKAKLKTTEADWIVNFWRSVKTEMVNATHNGVQLPNDTEEIRILKSMLKQRQKAIEEFSKSSSPNAVLNLDIARVEANMLVDLLPQTPDPAKVIEETACVINTFLELKAMEDPGFNPTQLQRYTKDIISKVKEKYPLADNAVIVKVIKEYISK